MKEAIFNTEVVKSLKRHGCWVYKIRDEIFNPEARFSSDKPCDIVAGVGGRLVLIEGKQMKKWRSFGMKDLRPSQVLYMDWALVTGHRAFVFLNVRLPAVKAQGQRRENRLIIFDYEKFKTRKANYFAKDLKQLSFIAGEKLLYSKKFTGFNLSGFIFMIEAGL